MIRSNLRKLFAKCIHFRNALAGIKLESHTEPAIIEEQNYSREKRNLNVRNKPLLFHMSMR